MKPELYRRVQAKGMVRPFGVIEEEPVSESSVEVRQVVEEHVLVVMHELFLEGTIEAFRVGAYVRETRIGPPIGDAVLVEMLLGVALELRAVVEILPSRLIPSHSPWFR